MNGYLLFTFFNCGINVIGKWLAEFFNVLRWVHVKELIKLLSKIFRIVNTHHVRSFLNGFIGIDKNFGSFPQPDETNKAIR